MAVSVIIPCLDAEKWLEVAVTSALDQGPLAAEVIVVDNGSTDGSLAVAARLAKSDPRVKLMECPVRHACAARNIGWRASTGEWTQFLDADDRLGPEKITKQLREGDGDFLVSPVIEETWRDGRGVHFTEGGMQAPTDWWEAWIRWEVAQTGAVLWRKSTLEKIGGWNENQPRCQDNEITLRALQAGLNPAFCPTPGTVYRHWSEDTISRRDPTATIRERTRLTDSLLDWLSARGELTADRCRAAQEMFFGMARTLARINLNQAVAYEKERGGLGRWRVTGAAAPWRYKCLAGLIGFKNTEKICTALRPR